MKLTTHLRLVSVEIKNNLMAGTGTSLPLPLHKANVVTCQSVTRVLLELLRKGEEGRLVLPDPVLGSSCNSSANIEW